MLYRMSHEKPARRLVDERGRRSTRRRAGLSWATLYIKRELLCVKMHGHVQDTLSNRIVLVRSLLIYSKTRTAT